MKRIVQAVGVVGLGALLGILVGPAPAAACGGLVCSGGNPFNPVQVDQVNERILFVLEDDGAAGTLLTAVIQIQYEGSVDDFAWILPVPEVPENIDVASEDVFDDLDATTAPSFNFLFNFTPGFGCSMFGCAMGASPDLRNEFGPGGDGEGPVNVWGTGTAGPFEMAVISSDTVDPLLEWIYRHGFDAPDEFVEIADDYVKDNYKFVVVRLQPAAGVDQIAPIVLQYHEENPCVPLRLTSIAAVPDMGVRVWIVGDARAVPLNYRNVSPDYTKLGLNGITTYDDFIATEIEISGGKGWVTEFAGSTALALNNTNTGTFVTNEETIGYLERGVYVTRLYTKISPWEMDEDPFFQLDPMAGDVSNARTVFIDQPVSSGSSSWSAALLGDMLLVAAILGIAVIRRRRSRAPTR